MSFKASASASDSGHPLDDPEPEPSWDTQGIQEYRRAHSEFAERVSLSHEVLRGLISQTEKETTAADRSKTLSSRRFPEDAKAGEHELLRSRESPSPTADEDFLPSNKAADQNKSGLDPSPDPASLIDQDYCARNRDSSIALRDSVPPSRTEPEILEVRPEIELSKEAAHPLDDDDLMDDELHLVDESNHNGDAEELKSRESHTEPVRDQPSFHESISHPTSDWWDIRGHESNNEQANDDVLPMGSFQVASNQIAETPEDPRMMEVNAWLEDDDEPEPPRGSFRVAPNQIVFRAFISGIQQGSGVLDLQTSHEHSIRGNTSSASQILQGSGNQASEENMETSLQVTHEFDKRMLGRAAELSGSSESRHSEDSDDSEQPEQPVPKARPVLKSILEQHHYLSTTHPKSGEAEENLSEHMADVVEQAMHHRLHKNKPHRRSSIGLSRFVTGNLETSPEVQDRRSRNQTILHQWSGSFSLEASSSGWEGMITQRFIDTYMNQNHVLEGSGGAFSVPAGGHCCQGPEQSILALREHLQAVENGNDDLGNVNAFPTSWNHSECERFVNLGGNIFDPNKHWSSVFPWELHLLHQICGFDPSARHGTEACWPLFIHALNQIGEADAPDLDLIRGPSLFRGLGSIHASWRDRRVRLELMKASLLAPFILVLLPVLALVPPFSSTLNQFSFPLLAVLEDTDGNHDAVLFLLHLRDLGRIQFSLLPDLGGLELYPWFHKNDIIGFASKQSEDLQEFLLISFLVSDVCKFDDPVNKKDVVAKGLLDGFARTWVTETLARAPPTPSSAVLLSHAIQLLQASKKTTFEAEAVGAVSNILTRLFRAASTKRELLTLLSWAEDSLKDPATGEPRELFLELLKIGPEAPFEESNIQELVRDSFADMKYAAEECRVHLPQTKFPPLRLNPLCFPSVVRTAVPIKHEEHEPGPFLMLLCLSFLPMAFPLSMFLPVTVLDKPACRIMDAIWQPANRMALEYSIQVSVNILLMATGLGRQELARRVAGILRSDPDVFTN